MIRVGDTGKMPVLRRRGWRDRLLKTRSKKSAKMKTDLTRDVGWETVAKAGWQAVSQISVDDTWSALRFRPAAEVGRR